MPFFSSCLRVKATSIEPGSSAGDLDQVEAELGRLADGPGAFVVAPAGLPYERVHAQLVHRVIPCLLPCCSFSALIGAVVR